MILWFRGGCSSPRETEVEWKVVDCKIRVKTRLGSNYSYYVILIVEESQPEYMRTNRDTSRIRSMSHRIAFRA